MAWRSGIGESGLELSLGLPAYFSKNSSASVQAEGSNRAAAFAVQSNGSSSSKARLARTAAAPVVGWPPVRSFRRNLASSSSSKPATSSSQNAEKSSKDGGGGCSGGNEHAQKGMFVKINMDGVPIGRKVDLTAYGGYAELSSAVDKLFRGLLAGKALHLRRSIMVAVC
uniref:Auxin-responsive protein n=1 Tax=Oryza brachyantha TaxID=4533 RepID=J3KX63_ORYBR